MRKKLFLISILLFCSAFSRSTTFDDRSSCEKSEGVWREFGNSCADGCESKLNQFSVCAMAFTNGCECGKSRCWDFDKKICVNLKDYKKIFDAQVAEEKKIAEEAKKKREEEVKEIQQTILTNINHNNAGTNQNNADQKPAGETPAATTPATQPATPANPVAQAPSPLVNNPPPVPPLFLQKEQAQKEAEEKKKKEEGKNLAPAIPGLPVIPLPK